MVNTSSVGNRVFGHIDLDDLKNAALMAEIEPVPVTELPFERWQRIIDVNLTEALRCTRAVLPAPLQQGYGKIVNQVSGGAFLPSGVHGVTKIGLVSLTAHLSHELAADGIRVNAIAPGFTNTPTGSAAAGEAARDAHAASGVAFPLGDPTDLTGTQVLLASAASDWITGQTIDVDGGWIHRI